MNVKILGDDLSFTEETFVEFKDRYDGFGKYIYEKINERYPDVFLALLYYRREDNQQKDSYAVYYNDLQTFAIQLNYFGEVIVLWNETIQFEIGVWADNEYELAIKDIEEYFLFPLSNKDTIPQY